MTYSSNQPTSEDLVYESSSSTEIGAALSSTLADIIPPQAPLERDTFTNPTTGGLYYYIRGGQGSGNLNKHYKNSWVFVPHGKDFQTNPPYDPNQGNLWVDRNNAYLVYVWNDGTINYSSTVGWTALTTKKRAYDHFVLQIADSPSELTDVIEAPGTLTYSIYKQGYIYFNRNNLNLYVWNGDTDEYGVPTNPNPSDAWVSITQHELVPDETVQSTFSKLKEEITKLEMDVLSLKQQYSID